MTLFAALAAAAAAVVLFPAHSGAATTTDPVVTTDAATSVTSTSATLNGTVTLNDDVDGTYTFQWGTTSGVYTDSTSGAVPAGASGLGIAATISSLTPATTYFYEFCAMNSDGNEVCDNGVDEQTFTTAPAAPDATTGSSSLSTTTTSATLNGTVNPNGDSTSYVFYYSTSSSVACDNSSSISAGGGAGSGTTPTAVSDTISGLAANTTYYFRLYATNSVGPTCSSVVNSFTTPNTPTPVTGSATAIGAHTATLNGTVNPNGSNVTSVLFEYCTGTGCDPSTGSTVAAAPSPGSGTNAVSVSANLTGLQSGTSFHYMLCATNAYGGPNCGADKTFTTDTPPTAVLAADTPTTGPVPFTVTFDGSGSSDPDPGDAVVSYTFSFGDGSAPVTQSTPTVAHTYTSPCSPCTASLTVTDKEGATSSPATLVIHANANQPPVAILTATPTPTTGTVPLAVTFDGSQSNDPDNIPLKSWSLDFGDSSTKATGTGAVPNNIQHTYSAPGTYYAVLTVTDSSNASTSSTAVTVTVNPQPTISIGDVSQDEGNSGTTNFDFPVTLSAISTHDVTVQYATADGTATAGSDYIATNGTLTIPAGTDCTNPEGNPACQIPVPVIGNTIYENNETFTLTLSNPTGATIPGGTATATGTIINDDQPPWLEIGYGATLEGNTGSVVDGAQSMSNGGSLQLNDASGFPNSEGPHTFYISTPGAAPVLGPYTYHGVSGNTLTGISLTGGPVAIAAGQIAFQPRFITLPVYLCDPQKSPDKSPADCVPITSGLDTTVQYETHNGQSLTTGIPVIEGQDYVYAAGTLTIPAGQTSGSITFETIPNTTPENPNNPEDDLTRWFNVLLTNPTNATIASNLGIATIIEDDGLNPPTATTGAASSIGADHATVAATVNPNGDATDVYVQYGPTDSYGSQTATQSLPPGNSAVPLEFHLTGLSPGTTYHYQVVATHADHSTGYGHDMTFTTDKLPKAVLKASPTSGPLPLEVTFNGSGSSDPDGSIASWTLAFGDGTPSTGGTGPVPSTIPHTYTSACSCTASLIVTDNQGAKSKPATVVIKAGSTNPGPSPKLSNYHTQVLGATSAKIAVSVDPNGAPTNVWIEYGKDTKYGNNSPAKRVSPGATRTLKFTLTGLSPHTLYHYLVMAVHITDSGENQSHDRTLKTQRAKPMTVTPSQVVTVTAAGTALLPFSCRGNTLSSCKGQAQLELGNQVVGTTSFSVPRGHRKLVSVRLKTSALSKLRGSGRLHLDLTLSVRTGLGVDLTTDGITLLAPRG